MGICEKREATDSSSQTEKGNTEDRYFAVCSGSPSTRAYKTDSCLVHIERLAAAEWILYFGVAYLHKICISGTAMLLEGGMIVLMERFQGALPPMPVSPAFTGVWPKSTLVWDDILRFARLARHAPRESRFVRKYCVTRVEEYAVTLDPTNGTVLTASEFSVCYPIWLTGPALVCTRRLSGVKPMLVVG